MKLLTHLHSLLKLSMSGSVPLLPLCPFKVWTVTTSYLPHHTFTDGCMCKCAYKTSKLYILLCITQQKWMNKRQSKTTKFL